MLRRGKSSSEEVLLPIAEAKFINIGISTAIICGDVLIILYLTVNDIRVIAFITIKGIINRFVSAERFGENWLIIFGKWVNTICGPIFNRGSFTTGSFDFLRINKPIVAGKMVIIIRNKESNRKGRRLRCFRRKKTEPTRLPESLERYIGKALITLFVESKRTRL